jgi:hypothetical protein
MYFIKGANVKIRYSGQLEIPAKILNECVRMKGSFGEPMQMVKFANGVTGWCPQESIIGKPGDTVL